MNNSSTRFLIQTRGVRGQVVRLDDTIEQILANAAYPKAVANILAQAVVVTVALGQMIKLQGSLVLQTKTDGAVKSIVTQIDENGHVRGLAHWDESLLAKGDQDSLLGRGHLVVTLDAEKRGDSRYQGIVAVNAGQHIAEVIETYFVQSEQLKTRIWVAVEGAKASAIVLQQLPESEQSSINDWSHCVVLAETVLDDELLGLEPHPLLHRLYHEEDVLVYDPQPIEFHCHCSPDRVEKALLSLGQEDAIQLAQEQQTIHINCEFCNKAYSYDLVDVAALFTTTAEPGHA